MGSPAQRAILRAAFVWPFDIWLIDKSKRNKLFSRTSVAARAVVRAIIVRPKQSQSQGWWWWGHLESSQNWRSPSKVVGGIEESGVFYPEGYPETLENQKVCKNWQKPKSYGVGQSEG